MGRARRPIPRGPERTLVEGPRRDDRALGRGSRLRLVAVAQVSHVVARSLEDLDRDALLRARAVVIARRAHRDLVGRAFSGAVGPAEFEALLRVARRRDRLVLA